MLHISMEHLFYPSTIDIAFLGGHIAIAKKLLAYRGIRRLL
jgi:hypothetical protein